MVGAQKGFHRVAEGWEVPRGRGERRVGGQKHRKSGARRVESPTFRAFFPLPPHLSFFLPSLGGALAEFWRGDPQMSTFGWCEAAAASHDRCPGIQKHHQNSSRRPPRQGRKNENCGGGGGEKKARNFGRSAGGAVLGRAVLRRAEGRRKKNTKEQRRSAQCHETPGGAFEVGCSGMCVCTGIRSLLVGLAPLWRGWRHPARS